MADLKDIWSDVSDVSKNMMAATVIVGTCGFVALSCDFKLLAGVAGTCSGLLSIVSVRSLYRDLFRNGP